MAASHRAVPCPARGYGAVPRAVPLPQHPRRRGRGGEKPDPRRLGRERGSAAAREEAARPSDSSAVRRGRPHPGQRGGRLARPGPGPARRWRRQRRARAAAVPGRGGAGRGRGARREAGAGRPSACGRPEPCGAAGGRGGLRAGPPRCSCCGSACRRRGPTTWTPSTRCSSGGATGPSSGTRFSCTATARSDGESSPRGGPLRRSRLLPAPPAAAPHAARLCPAGSWRAPRGPAGPPTARWPTPGPFSGAGSGGTPAGGASSSSWVSWRRGAGGETPALGRGGAGLGGGGGGGARAGRREAGASPAAARHGTGRDGTVGARVPARPARPAAPLPLSARQRAAGRFSCVLSGFSCRLPLATGRDQRYCRRAGTVALFPRRQNEVHQSLM